MHPRAPPGVTNTKEQTHAAAPEWDATPGLDFARKARACTRSVQKRHAQSTCAPAGSPRSRGARAEPPSTDPSGQFGHFGTQRAGLGSAPAPVTGEVRGGLAGGGCSPQDQARPRPRSRKTQTLTHWGAPHQAPQKRRRAPPLPGRPPVPPSLGRRAAFQAALPASFLRFISSPRPDCALSNQNAQTKWAR